MLAWGANPLITRFDHSTNEVIFDKSEVKDLALGSYRTFVLFCDSSVHGYGEPSSESIEGPPGSSEMTNLKEREIVGIFSGWKQMFAIDKKKTVYGWGCNDRGQLGIDKNFDITVTIPTALSLTQKVAQISCGQQHTLLLATDGVIYSMGDNSFGQLGLCKDLKTPVGKPRFVDSLKGVPIIQVAAGGWHSFCVTASGRVFSWGRNSYGQLGRGDKSAQVYPQLLKSDIKDPIAFIAAGDNHSALLTRKGALFTFGLGSDGQLGHGDFLESHPVPGKVAEFEGSVVTQVACGSTHTVVYVPDCQQVFVFGNNKDGQLGPIGGAEKVAQPTMVKGPWCDGGSRNINKIYAGGNQTYILMSASVNEQTCDFRNIKSHHRIATLDDELCERISKFDCDDPQHDDVITELQFVLSSQSCLNGSFASVNDFVVSDNFHGIDFEKARLLSSKIFKNANSAIKEAIIESIGKTLIPNLSRDPPDPEALKLYIILPILLERIKHPQSIPDIIFLFLENVLKLHENPRKILKKWFKTLKQEDFLPLITLCKISITEVLFGTLRNRVEPTLIGRSLEFLRTLHDVNVSVEIVNYKEFYIKDLSHIDVLSMDYKAWKKRTPVGTTPVFCEYPFVLDAKAKNMLLEINTRERFRITCEHALPIIRLLIHRENLVADAINQLNHVKCLQSPLRVRFVGEEGIDDGALRKEFFMLVLQEVTQLKYGLFHENETSNLLWFSPYQPGTEDVYKLIGSLCGMALYNNIIVNVNLPLALYKKILGEEPDLNDFKELDPYSGNSLQQVLDLVEDDDITVEDVFGLDFTTDDGLPLKEGGTIMAVTAENREEYAKLRLDRIFNKSVKKQFEAFYEGFLKACEHRMLHLFRPEELMEMVVGIQEYDWEELKRSTHYPGDQLSLFTMDVGFDLQHPTIKWFWEVLLAMSRDEKEKFLLFLTGTIKIPLTGLNMKILKRNECDDFLPVADVCYNQLHLHPYSSKEILEERLKLAIKCKGFHRI